MFCDIFAMYYLFYPTLAYQESQIPSIFIDFKDIIVL